MNNSDLPGIIAPPPVIYLSVLAISYLIHFIWPLQITQVDVRDWIGGILIFTGIALIIWAGNTMHCAKTNINPYKPTLILITDGPFRFSRNPIYVAMTGIYFGIAFLINSLWPFVMLAPLIEIMKWGVISREEKYLDKKFGAAYQLYQSKVKRWL